MTITADQMLTAEEYRILPDPGYPTELVRGRIVTVNMPSTRHGFHCGRIVYVLSRFLDDYPTGRVACNDSGVVTEQEPDTVRGSDVSYYSFARLPKGPIPDGYAVLPPEIIFEVKSPSDRWSEILEKVAEYLKAGVNVVCVLDPQTSHLTVFRADEEQVILRPGDQLTFPEILEGFSVDVAQFFA